MIVSAPVPPLSTNFSSNRLWLSLFIAWNLFCLFVWVGLPECALKERLLFVVQPYMMMTGLCQDFWVFCPDVNTSSADIVADVTLADGKQVRWKYPSNTEASLLEKPFKERYREFATSILARKNRFLLPDVVSYIAGQVYAQQPQNPPSEVSIRVLWKQIPPPGSDATEKGENEIFKARVEVDQ